jgi:hypothetical protein
MVKLSAVRTDPKAEAEGVWLEYVPGFRCKIASTATKQFRDGMEAAMAPYRDLIRADQGKDKGERKFTDDMRDGVMREVIAQHVLLGWEGLEDESGEPLAYSQAEAVKLLADPTMHRLVQWLETAASSAEVYRVERLERDRKN